MNNPNALTRSFARKAYFAAVFAMASMGAWAQDTTTTSILHGVPTYNTEVRNAQVVYVEGNDLVLKLESGKVEHLIVPDSDKFTIDGKTLSVRELKPGTKLTQTITTSTAPRYVTSVRTLKGKVWHVNAPKTVIVSLPDHTNQIYSVPSHAKFFVDGKPKTVFDLKKGMTFQATIVSDSTETVVSQNKAITGTAPAPATVPLVGVLLFQRPAPVMVQAPEPVTVAAEEQPADTLPKTGSTLPAVGFLGALALFGGIALSAVRRKVTA
jgi:LPXTG-motif cell wall-anchored protein